MERDIVDKLKKVYNVRITRDKFGKRPALPSEIQAKIDPKNMEEGLEQFSPTESDIKEKKSENG